MRSPTRKELEASLEAYFRKAVRDQLAGHMVKLAPTEKGVPDRLVMLPGGRLFLVELKADGGRLSPAQEYWHGRADNMGIQIHVLEGRGQIYQWCVDRVKELDEEDMPTQLKSKSPEYVRGYKTGYQTASKRAQMENQA